MRTEKDAGTGHALDEVAPWFAGGAERPLLGLTVLLVEDSRLASEAMRLLCLRSGARIRRADSLKSAARHLRAYRPGVAIVDMGLPDGDGAALIAQIAATMPRVPVLLGLSGDPDREAEAMAAGADGFMAKPVTSLALFQETILGHLPPGGRLRGLRLLPDEVVEPDATALHDDLAYLAQLLAPGIDAETCRYAGQFLAGLGRVADDPALGAAAAALLQTPDEPAALHVRALIEKRLAGGRLI